MQRLTMQIDMGDDEILDKATQQIIEGAVKNKVRAYVAKQLNDTIDSIVKEKLDNLFKTDWKGKNRIEEIVTDIVQKKVQEICLTQKLLADIRQNALDFAAKKANSIIEDQLDTFDTKVYVDNTVYSIVKKVVSGHVLNVLLDNMDKIDIKDE